MPKNRGGETVQARRFLHCCYCCDDALGTTRFLEEGLGLSLVMRSHGQRVDGTQMGFSGDVETDACFVYDGRGPRVGPGVEVQQWIDPPLAGEPYPDDQHVGFHAIGAAVRDLDDAAGRLVALGARRLDGTGQAPSLGAATVTLRDPNGIGIDLVESGADAAPRLAHLRATCTDLERSCAWYEALGFERVGDEASTAASSARLCLPDEPFALVLTQWHDPPSHGRPYASGNHRGLYRFAIAVDDTRAAYDALSERWDLTSPPRPVELGGTNVPVMWVAFLADPDGLRVELVERPRSAFRSS